VCNDELIGIEPACNGNDGALFFQGWLFDQEYWKGTEQHQEKESS
jgi:hypothetical protein